MPSVRSRWLQNRISPRIAALTLELVLGAGVATVGAGVIELVAEAPEVEAGGPDGGALGDAVEPHPDTATATAAASTGMAPAVRNLVMTNTSCGRVWLVALVRRDLVEDDAVERLLELIEAADGGLGRRDGIVRPCFED